MTRPEDHHDTRAPDILTSTNAYRARFAGAVGEWLLEVQFAAVRAALDAAGAKNVLDVGGGHGQLAGPLIEKGYDVEIAGSTPESVGQAGSLVESGKCKFTTCDLGALPWEDRSFDAVVAVRVMAHASQWGEILREMARVSRGLVVVDYPKPMPARWLFEPLLALKKRTENVTRPWRSFRHEQVDSVLRAVGYEGEDRTGLYALPMVLHRILGVRAVSAASESALRSVGITKRFGSPVVACYRRRD